MTLSQHWTWKQYFTKQYFFSLTGNHWWRQNIYWKSIVKNSDLALSNFASRNRISQSIFQDFLEYFSELSEDLQIEAVAVFFLEFGPTLIERERQKKATNKKGNSGCSQLLEVQACEEGTYCCVCQSGSAPTPNLPVWKYHFQQRASPHHHYQHHQHLHLLHLHLHQHWAPYELANPETLRPCRGPLAADVDDPWGRESKKKRTIKE